MTEHPILPRLVSFTHEDRAAKGLRVFAGDAEPEVAVQFTAAEMVSMHRAQLLHAPRGGGKTTLANELADALTEARGLGTGRLPEALCRPAVRNPEGLTLPQVWEVGALHPLLAAPGQGRAALAEARARSGAVLLILDGLEREADPSALVRDAMAWISGAPEARLLVLCESGALEAIRLHPDLRVHGLLPLLRPERKAALTPLGQTDPCDDLWVWPGLWALSLAEGRALSLAEAAATPAAEDWLQEARDAAELAALSADEIATRAQQDPARWGGPLRLLVAERGTDAALADALAGAGPLPLLLAAADLTQAKQEGASTIASALTHAIAQGGAAPALRRRAGEALARLGDPRALDALVSVPAGTYTMGGDLHPNSAPAHRVTLRGFRIGAYPVTCGAYLRFVEDTGRSWVTANGRAPERASHPATDLTWHDARNYCAWLTERWRADGRIAAAQSVRLPTEREWEAAARGADGFAYPWGQDWAPEHANDEETAFNDICTVGLFREGASPFGCFDMAGQVWEWCTTLWGTDMAAPSFAFPWAEDGREALDASPEVRRVLRGGCFSSGRLKANGIYRGSLEPNGFWRGNGFRVVVS
ncbi:formylglycine-generating enzyme family protein [Alloyangia pacifica]|uniref:formylglycine-generating enzyme family protein n=1 Tax=Alloyangia pacifica TaxID=311180 RepID=UPI001CFF46B4|nr:formylglycine-generating enzyme family protein [Alloyangia pacifica]